MSDWRDDEFHDEHGERRRDDEWSRAQSPRSGEGMREGVRIVGEPPPPGDPAYGAYGQPTPAPAHDPYGAPTNPASRFPLPDEGASWSASDDHGQPAAPGSGGGGDAQLPHWSEPPTGEVPAALGGGGPGGDDDFDTWSSLSGPRFRTGDSDWAEDDFGDLRRDDGAALGALAEDEHEEWAPPSRRQRRGRRGLRRPQQPPADEYAEHSHDDYGDRHDDYGGDVLDEHQQGPENLVSRIATAGVVAGVALLAFALGRVTAMLLVAVIVGLCAFELYEAFRRAGYHTATVMGLLASVAAVPVAYEYGERGVLLIAVLAVVFTFLWYLLEVVRARPTINIALTLLVFAWVGLFGAFAGLFLANDPGGTGLLLGVAICAVGADVVAYFAGSAIGKTPLLPNVSPNKTVEGLVAGAVAAIVLGAVVGAALHPWADEGIGAGLALGLVVAITAPLGDLSESLIKRDLGLKDLGSFLPGHGGFLDRFDAILFTLPAAYYLALEIFT